MAFVELVSGFLGCRAYRFVGLRELNVDERS